MPFRSTPDWTNMNKNAREMLDSPNIWFRFLKDTAMYHAWTVESSTLDLFNPTWDMEPNTLVSFWGLPFLNISPVRADNIYIYTDIYSTSHWLVQHAHLNATYFRGHAVERSLSHGFPVFPIFSTTLWLAAPQVAYHLLGNTLYNDQSSFQQLGQSSFLPANTTYSKPSGPCSGIC